MYVGLFVGASVGEDAVGAGVDDAYEERKSSALNNSPPIDLQLIACADCGAVQSITVYSLSSCLAQDGSTQFPS